MNRISDLWSSKARFVLFLLSFLGATAFYCNQPQHKKRFSGSGVGETNRNVPTKSALPQASLFALMMTLQKRQNQQQQKRFSISSTRLSERTLRKGNIGFEGLRKKRKCRCPDDDERETLEDRREALFATMGGLWAVATTTTSSSTALLGFANPSFATSGVDAKMAFPDVLGGMEDRQTKQCLVESVGNRECLVYKETDPDKLLYKGVNANILVERTKRAAAALAEIPALVEKKKWNDINGLLIGPMGELSSTLTLLCGDDAAKTKLARKVKEVLFAMGTANTQRQQDAILKHQAAATKDLAKFLEVAL